MVDFGRQFRKQGWILVTISLAYCTPKFNTSGIQAIQIISSYPMLDKDAKIQVLRDTIPVYSDKDLFLYLLPYHEINEGRLNDTTKYHYFIFPNNSNSGYLIADELNAMVRVSVDSVKEKYAHVPKRTAFEIPNGFTQVSKIISNGERIVSFISTENYGELSIDSFLYCFNRKLDNIRFSFSPKSDSIEGMKLYKIRQVYNSKFSSVINKQLPSREIVIKFEEIESFDKKAIKEKICSLKKKVNMQYPEAFKHVSLNLTD